MVVALCLGYWLRRYGESFRIGVQYYRGLFFQPPTGMLRWLYSAEQLAELPRPLWAVVHEPSLSLPIGTQLVWRAQPYTVINTLEFRHDTTAIYRLSLISPEGVNQAESQGE